MARGIAGLLVRLKKHTTWALILFVVVLTAVSVNDIFAKNRRRALIYFDLAKTQRRVQEVHA